MIKQHVTIDIVRHHLENHSVSKGLYRDEIHFDGKMVFHYSSVRWYHSFELYRWLENTWGLQWGECYWWTMGNQEYIDTIFRRGLKEG